MNVLIVEDEIIIAAELAQLLQEMEYQIAGIAVNYSNAVKFLQSNPADLAIIDINLGGSKTGIDLGTYINDNNKIPFIFLTSSVDNETVKLALNVQPHAYLLKPFNKVELLAAISLALRQKVATAKEITDKNSTEWIIDNAIFVKQKDLFVKVLLSDIICFKSDKNYIEVVTDTKTYIIRSTISSLLAELPEEQFFRTHKSYIVNVKKITAINHELLMAGSMEIPVSESYRKDLLQRLKTFS